MKIAPIVTLVLAILVAMVMLTTMSLLSQLDTETADVRLADLSVGRLYPLFTGPTLWSEFPSFPKPQVLVHLVALCVVGIPIAMILYVLGVRRQLSLDIVGLAVLLLGFFPYVLGKAVLQAGSQDPAACGLWVAVMVIGVFYTSCVAACLAGLEIGFRLLQRFDTSQMSDAPQC